MGLHESSRTPSQQMSIWKLYLLLNYLDSMTPQGDKQTIHRWCVVGRFASSFRKCFKPLWKLRMKSNMYQSSSPLILFGDSPFFMFHMYIYI